MAPVESLVGLVQANRCGWERVMSLIPTSLSKCSGLQSLHRAGTHHLYSCSVQQLICGWSDWPSGDILRQDKILLLPTPT